MKCHVARLGCRLAVSWTMLVPLTADVNDIVLKITGPSEVTLHEPVIVTVNIDNRATSPRTLDLGTDREGHFKLALTGPDGVVRTVSPTLEGVGGISRMPRVTVEPRQAYSQPLIVNKWFDLGTAGDYLLHVTFSGGVSETGEVVHANETLQFRILPLDERRLRETCEALLSRTSAGPYESRREAASILSRVHDPVVVDYLRRAIDGAPELAWVMIGALERLGTPGAVRVLEDVSRSSRGETATLARAALLRLRQRHNQ